MGVAGTEKKGLHPVSARAEQTFQKLTVNSNIIITGMGDYYESRNFKKVGWGDFIEFIGG